MAARMAKSRNGFAPEPTWYVFHLRHTPATFVGSVEAPDAETAIKRAIEKFNITDPQQQQRLIARWRS
jgi:1,2-phenylacetyl-CoA epoxidase PaaB subunit